MTVNQKKSSVVNSTVEKFGTGPAQDPGNKKQAPLMCPHCGWTDELIYIERK